MAQSPIAAEIHQAFDIHGDIAPEIALHHVILVNHFTDLDYFRIRQFIDAAAALRGGFCM